MGSIVRTVALAALLVASSLAQDLGKTCTKTIEVPAQCCPPKNKYTSTASVDCGGCALTTSTTGFACLIFCETPTATVASTTTVTACAASGHPSLISSSPTMPCTNVITSTRPFSCTITAAAQTVISETECEGCALSTAFVAPKRYGHGPVCVGGVKTVTDEKVTATVTACA